DRRQNQLKEERSAGPGRSVREVPPGYPRLPTLRRPSRDRPTDAAPVRLRRTVGKSQADRFAVQNRTPNPLRSPAGFAVRANVAARAAAKCAPKTAGRLPAPARQCSRPEPCVPKVAGSVAAVRV